MSVVHGTFRIERELPHAPATVFAAWSDPAAKAKWFSGNWTPLVRETDFRDIVAERRIVYGYDMFVDEKKISPAAASAAPAR